MQSSIRVWRRGRARMAVGWVGLCLWLGSIHAAETLPAAVSEGVNLEAVLEPIRSAAGLPALAAVVVDRSGVVAAGAVGLRAVGHSEKVTVQDEFHLGSCTKAFTGTLAGLLVQDGKISWDLTIEEALPTQAAAGLAAYRKVTLRQLLAHRAGLPHTLPPGKTLDDLRKLTGSERQQRLVWVGWLLTSEPVYPPGTKQAYSNAGYAIAAAMIEARMNQSWEALVEARILKPLGMTTAGYGPMGRAEVYDQPRQHTMEGANFVAVEPNLEGKVSDNPVALTPAGRLHCSVLDWAKFVQLHLSVESTGPVKISAATMQVLHTPLPGGEATPGGWMVCVRDWAGGTALNHTGTNTMNYTNVWLSPSKGFAVLVATNAPDFEPTDKVAGALIAMYLAGKFPAKNP